MSSEDQRWVELCAYGRDETAEPLRALLETPPFCTPVEELDLRPGHEGETCLRSWAPAEGLAPETAELMKAAVEAHPGWRAELRVLGEADWTDAWKRFFHPVRAAEGLWVAPPWEAASEAGPEDIVVEIDPGLAFGTGGHATTLLCLRVLRDLLAETDEAPTLLDVGCGSGILAIAAAQLGAARPLRAVDIDEAAVRATAENAERNGVTGAIECDATPVGELLPRYDIVVANIISGVLVALAEDIAARVAPGGRLVLSGVLARSLGEDTGQVEEVLEAYARCGLIQDEPGCVEAESDDDFGRWVALRLRRP